MEVFEKQITVTETDLDSRNHVNNVRYVQWVQDVAEEHWLKKTSDEIRAEYYWIMLSHFIQYKAEALLHDTLILKTFVTKSEGLRSTRMVEIYNQSSGKLLTSSETIWCFMSHKTQRPTRITDEIALLFD
ncbi:MAG: acyl-CoA thioesterase [Psychroserpens sp.]|nr:acyl-CoA thioesterase [Psychroserpens sp.]